ncbi:MAG: hypothetical protein JWM53_1719 [bacterium]|nr:hypothetical protein [bacterium]
MSETVSRRGVRRWRLAVATLCGCLVATGDAGADSTPAFHPFGYEARVLIALNPGSANVAADFHYHRRLYASPRPLLSQNELMVQVGTGISPASIRPVLRVSVQPLSVLRLWIQYEGEGFFGSSGFARSFPSPASDYGRGLLGSPPAGPPGSTGSYHLWVNKLELAARLQLQRGHWMIRSTWRAVHFDASLAPGDRVLYEPWIDNVVYAHGWAVQNDDELGFVLSPGGSVIGARATVTLVFYPSDAYAPGEPQVNLNSPTVRVGPFVRCPLLEPNERRRSITQLFLAGVAQFYLVDRFHTDVRTPAAVPFLALSLIANGDL